MASQRAPVAGVDRWRGGWITAEFACGQLSWKVASHVTELISLLEDCAVVAIDMPISLVAHGRRVAEQELRGVLGSSARSVFTSPTRAAVAAPTQSEATILNRANGGPGISAQAFGLFASIQELREHLSGPGFHHWTETHPETSFALMNDGVPFASKRTGLGVAQRLNLLRREYPTIDDDLLVLPAKVPIDDALDAVAALWSARRVATGTAACFGPAERDDEGFGLGILV